MTKYLIICFIFLSFSFFISTFLHECGHGFGSLIDGVKVSTGFNRVGDYGKFPSQPDFRSSQVITGKLDSGGLLGPFTTWTLAIVFTIFLSKREKADYITIFLGSMSVANSFLRIVPNFFFFISSISGNFTLEDEVAWGLSKTSGVSFPLSSVEFKKLALSNPEMFLSNPFVYFWPSVSILICSICLVISYKKLGSIFKDFLPHFLYRWVFSLLPLASFPLTFSLLNWLDSLVRINW
ncbi:MAG: hypothetical protein ACUVUG_02485 [Candidatus Aminicenantia bacterium]